MKRTINRTNITEHLIEHQLNIIGKTIKEIEEDDLWYVNNTLTEEQFEEFRRYAIPLLKKVFKFNKSKAESINDFVSQILILFLIIQ
jgi:hypothetical protein